MRGLFGISCCSAIIAAATLRRRQTAQRNSPAQAATAQDDAEHQHPAGFKEPGRYINSVQRASNFPMAAMHV